MPPKVTIHEKAAPTTPTEEVIAAANEITYVTDALGRRLGLRQPDFLEEFRIVEAVGPETAANTTYMGMLNPLLWLVEIDGDEVRPPRTKVQAVRLIERAGREGYLEIVKLFAARAETARQEAEEKIKNGDGIPD